MDEGQPDGDRHAGSAAPEAAATTRRRRPWLIALRVVVALLATVALLGTGTAWVTLRWFRGSANSTDVLAQIDQDPAAPPSDDGADDILLVGSDSRSDAQGTPLPAHVLKLLRTTANAGVNTDTIILLRIPRDGGRAYAISIPRDTYVRIPGIGNHKINSAFELTRVRKARELRAQGRTDEAGIRRESLQAGRAALAGVVQQLTGARIDHYVEINLYGFYLLSKAIGGVEVCLRAPTHDTDSGADFDAGPQLVSGGDALAFVRQRKHIPGGDLGRIQRQQVFLASAARTLLSAGVLTDPKRLSALADTARKALVMDPGLDLLSLAQHAASLASGNVTFVTIPVVTSNGRSPDGKSIVVVDRDRVRAFVRGLTGGGGTAGSPATAGATTTPVRHSAYVTAIRATGAPTPPVTIHGHRCVY